MKNLAYIMMLLLMVSCSSEGENSEADKNAELYEITDYFVESLDTQYDSYGFSGMKHAKQTADGKYKVMPVNRLVNVKILTPVEKSVYLALEAEIEAHYQNDPRVTDVFINNGGTIMIDCGN